MKTELETLDDLNFLESKSTYIKVHMNKVHSLMLEDVRMIPHKISRELFNLLCTITESDNILYQIETGDIRPLKIYQNTGIPLLHVSYAEFLSAMRKYKIDNLLL
ncbi:hypothetical protein N008_00085 [Hymenobacter sp. APR13]|nr:hypothetical protein N008_00085 [Hymenobacter sp. APR13]